MQEADYLVVGSGAMGMAFADVILAETDASIVIVDRHAKPGGHWNDAYPYVRLHQPSAFYGVNSRQLGSNTRDETGLNAGLFELASGPEVVSYFDQVMNQDFLPSGRVQYYPMSDFEEFDDGVATFRSLVSGKHTEIRANKVVNATYMNVKVPSQCEPVYAVADSVRCGPPNELPTLEGPAEAYVVVGAGKTGADAVLWLLANGVEPNDIRWIMPRDSWYLDRASIQPDNVAFSRSFETIAHSTSVADLFARAEANGQLLRLDQTVEPTMYRCNTLTKAEMDELRRLPRNNVIRLGRVQAIEADRIVLDDGEVSTSTDTFHIDCTADGLATRPAVPVFDGQTLTLQTVRHCQQVFSAAFIAHVEASYSDEAAKNELCTVVPHPDTHMDWLRTGLQALGNAARWGADAELMTWMTNARLDGFSSPEAAAATTPADREETIALARTAAAKLQEYLGLS